MIFKANITEEITIKSASIFNRNWVRFALLLLITVVLYLVFMMYSKPDFIIETANQLWSCF